MGSSVDILEVPLTETRDVNDLARWFEKNKVHEKTNPTIKISEKEESPMIYIVGLILVIGMALIKLEENGKLKSHSKGNKKSTNNFLNLLKDSSSEKSLEKLIESRYNLRLMLRSSIHKTVEKPESKEYSLDDVFGIWKDKKNSLDKVRDQQWGKRKSITQVSHIIYL